MKFAVIALIANTSAIALTREPLLSNSNDLEVHQRPAYADYPIDYVVPDFGKSHEIIYTENNIKNAEALLAHPLAAKWGETKNPVNPRDYFVPDFGLDQDIIGVNDGLSWAQTNLKHEWKPTKGADGYWNTPANAYN